MDKKQSSSSSQALLSGKYGDFEEYAHISEVMLPEEYNGKKHVGRLYLQYAGGDGMSLAGIHTGDVLLLDKEAEPEDGDIVIVNVENSGLMCRRFFRKDNKVWFRREDGITPDISPDSYTIMSVVIGVMKKGRFSSPDFDPNKRLMPSVQPESVKPCRDVLKNQGFSVCAG